MDSLIHPPSLVAGDHIALISPSRYTDSTMIEQAKQWAESLDAKGIPGSEVLALYMNSMRAAGATPLRDWDSE